MPPSVAQQPLSSHRVLPEKVRTAVKADLRKAESEDALLEIGECLDFARRYVGWTLDELAGQLPPPDGKEKRDPRQVQRWIKGEERCQVDVIFSVEALRKPFVIALARLSEQFEEELTLRAKRA